MTYLRLVFTDALTDERQGRLAIFDASSGIDQILAVVQFGSHVTDGPHVADESPSVRIHPTEYDICLRLCVCVCIDTIKISDSVILIGGKNVTIAITDDGKSNKNQRTMEVVSPKPIATQRLV